jgi:MerR family transcriptional regulator/heat shock protein HspR
VKRVLQLEREIQVLKEAVEQAQSQAAEDVDSLHRHYRRDLVPVKQAVVLYQRDRRR